MARRRSLLLCLLQVLALLAGTRAIAAEPLVLWRSIEVGMTEDQVRRLIPQARRNDGPSADETNEDGWKDLLQARLRADGRDQKVTFQFQDRRLMGVVVTEGEPFGLSPISQDTARATLADICKAHGDPVRCRETDDGFHACFWIERGKFIGYLERPQPASGVMLFFHAERPGERDLLR